MINCLTSSQATTLNHFSTCENEGKLIPKKWKQILFVHQVLCWVFCQLIDKPMKSFEGGFHGYEETLDTLLWLNEYL